MTVVINSCESGEVYIWNPLFLEGHVALTVSFFPYQHHKEYAMELPNRYSKMLLELALKFLQTGYLRHNKTTTEILHKVTVLLANIYQDLKEFCITEHQGRKKT